MSGLLTCSRFYLNLYFILFSRCFFSFVNDGFFFSLLKKKKCLIGEKKNVGRIFYFIFLNNDDDDDDDDDEGGCGCGCVMTGENVKMFLYTIKYYIT